MKKNNRDEMSVTGFVAKALGIVLVPVLFMVLVYVLVDPYGFFAPGNRNELLDYDGCEVRLMRNKGAASLQAFTLREAAGDVPDSYIFGASISCYYETDYWWRHIDASTMPMHFDSASEGARSLRYKIEFLKNRGVVIRNALIVLDPQVIELPPVGSGIFSMDHPRIAGWWTYPRWHYKYFMAFCNFDFLTSYIPACATGSTHNYGHECIFERQPMVYDAYRNEESIPAWDSIIHNRPEVFYAYRKFPCTRQLHCSNPMRITSEIEREYREIARLLGSTDYKVIVSPTLDCDTLSDRDDCLLREIFGSERYNNFTSSMHEVALNDSNWYDLRHYRAPAARLMMDRAYAR